MRIMVEEFIINLFIFLNRTNRSVKTISNIRHEHTFVIVQQLGKQPFHKLKLAQQNTNRHYRPYKFFSVNFYYVYRQRRPHFTRSTLNRRQQQPMSPFKERKTTRNDRCNRSGQLFLMKPQSSNKSSGSFVNVIEKCNE